MPRILCAILAPTLSLASAAASAQDPVLPAVRYPALPATAADAAGFAPRGWRVETQARGDLDGDGDADLAFTLRTERPVDTVTDIGMGAGRTFDSSPHILAVAFAGRGGGYRLALQNHVLIPRAWDPTQAGWMFEDGSLRISRGALLVYLEHLGSGVGTTTFRFRWQSGAFRLIGFDISDAHRYSGCLNLASINYVTGRVKRTVGNVREEAERVRWTRLRRQSLLTLDQVGDGVEFDPEGMVSGLGSCMEDRRE